MHGRLVVVLQETRATHHKYDTPPSHHSPSTHTPHHTPIKSCPYTRHTALLSLSIPSHSINSPHTQILTLILLTAHCLSAMGETMGIGVCREGKADNIAEQAGKLLRKASTQIIRCANQIVFHNIFRRGGENTAP